MDVFLCQRWKCSMIFSDITRCTSQSKENGLTWGAHLSAAAGGGRGVRGHLWWAWAFTNEKNILPDAVLNFMFWRVKNETCFHLINKTWCVWFAKTSNPSKVLNFGVSWWEAARPSTMQMEINASGTGNRWRPNERRWKRQSHPRRLMDGKKRPPGRPQGLDGNTESAVTVSKEDPASPQFDLNRQDATIKNQH